MSSGNTQIADVGMLHIRYDGQSYDYQLSRFDIGTESNDAQIKAAIANELNVPVEKLRNYRVEREGANITIRPEAVFG